MRLPYVRISKSVVVLGWKVKAEGGWQVRTWSFPIPRPKVVLRTEWSHDRSNEHTWIFLDDWQREARRKWWSYLMRRSAPRTEDGYSTRIPLLEDKR